MRKQGQAFPVLRTGSSSIWLINDDLVEVPVNSTFAAAIVRYLGIQMGQKWHDAEKVKGDDKHPLKVWYDEMFQHGTHKALSSTGMIAQIEPWGTLHSLLLLAYDVTVLIQTGNEPKQMLQKLRNKEQFQGMRYEVAVTRLLLQAKYSPNPIDNSKKEKSEITNRSEMVASYIPYQRDPKKLGDLSVEAKAIGRENILGKKYGEKILANVRSNLEKARSQIALPGVIFVDLNQDAMSHDQATKIVKEIESDLVDYDRDHQTNPANLYVFTNYSWHYKGQEESQSLRSFFDIPRNPTTPVDPILINEIIDAVSKYPNIPERHMKLDSLSAPQVIKTTPNKAS